MPSPPALLRDVARHAFAVACFVGYLVVAVGCMVMHVGLRPVFAGMRWVEGWWVAWMERRELVIEGENREYPRFEGETRESPKDGVHAT